MSEHLERFIRDNKNSFDELEPPAGLWDRIDRALEEKERLKIKKGKVVRLSVLLRVAAVVAIVLTAGILLTIRTGQKGISLSSVSPQLAEMQVQYAGMISERREEIRKVEKTDPYLYGEFSSEIRKMDTSYQRLNNELATSPNQEETVKAMVRNLQTQLEVLNQQLIVIQQIKQFKKEKNHDKQLL